MHRRLVQGSLWTSWLLSSHLRYRYRDQLMWTNDAAPGVCLLSGETIGIECKGVQILRPVRLETADQTFARTNIPALRRLIYKLRYLCVSQDWIRSKVCISMEISTCLPLPSSTAAVQKLRTACKIMQSTITSVWTQKQQRLLKHIKPTLEIASL